MLLIILGYFAHFLAGSTFPESLKHDYKLSLKYPFNGTALGFNSGGDISFSDRFIRVSPSIPNKHGFLFSANDLSYDNVIIDVAITVSGRGFVGGNGFGIWISNALKTENELYYGRNEDFNGFGVILSTSDKAITRKDPYIFGVENDGTRKASDFLDYISKTSNVLGGCFSNYRNTPDKFHLRIMILSHKLSVFTDALHHGKNFIKCFEANLKLKTPISGQYIGISANSFNLADDHDLFSLDVYQINPPAKKHLDHQKKELTSEEKKKIEHIQHIVDQVEKEKTESESYGDAVTGETVQHILETQFHIISQLEHLNNNYKDGSQKSTSSGTDSSKSDFRHLEEKVEALSAKVNTLIDKIDKFSNSINSGAVAIKQGLGDVHERITEAHNMIEEAHHQTTSHIGHFFSESNSAWSWVKYTGSIIGAAIIVYGLLALVRKREPRKFI